MPALSPLLVQLRLLSVAMLRTGSRRGERGASAVEYGLLVAGIAAIIVAMVFVLGQGVLNDLFTETCNSIGQNLGNNC
jgi:pilus assembly protein Flp/PilA